MGRKTWWWWSQTLSQWCPVNRQQAMAQGEIQTIPFKHKRKTSVLWGLSNTEQVAQRGCRASILGDMQIWTGYSFEQPALSGPAWPGGWTKRSLEAPAYPGYPLILQFCSTASYHPQVDNPTRYILLPDSLPSPFTLCVCGHPHSMFVYVCSHPHSNHLIYTVNLQIVSEMLMRNTWDCSSIPAELQCHQITLSFSVIKSLYLKQSFHKIHFASSLYSIITFVFILSTVTRRPKIYVLYYKTVLKFPAYTYS